MTERELIDIIERQAAEIRRLKAIVDKLPKTADGAPLYDGVEVWFWDMASYVWGGLDPGKWYSTREAAEAAGKETP